MPQNLHSTHGTHERGSGTVIHGTPIRSLGAHVFQSLGEIKSVYTRREQSDGWNGHFELERLSEQRARPAIPHSSSRPVSPASKSSSISRSRIARASLLLSPSSREKGGRSALVKSSESPKLAIHP